MKVAEGKMRAYRDEDAPELLKMLEAEGVKETAETFEIGTTRVLVSGDTILGFFSMDIRHQKPHLKHFYVSPDQRSGKIGSTPWVLMRAARRLAMMSGFGQMIVPAKKRRNIRLIHAYFRTLPYAQAEDGTAFFLVGV